MGNRDAVKREGCGHVARELLCSLPVAFKSASPYSSIPCAAKSSATVVVRAGCGPVRGDACGT